MDYSKILTSLSVPSWLIDELNELDPEIFLIWLEKNIDRLIYMSFEYRDMWDEFIFYNKDYVPFPEVF